MAIAQTLVPFTDADRSLVEGWLVEFDLTWNENRLDQLASDLEGSPLRSFALSELVKIDLERQWQHGQRPTLEAYLSRFPELGTPETVSAELIFAEWCVRKQFGEAVTSGDMIARFPRRKVEIERLGRERQAALESTHSVRAATTSTLSNPTPAPAKPATGQPERVGRYEIVKRLGQGGMGCVYLAHDSQLDRRVALKVPHVPVGSSQQFLERFYREARAAATLEHPNLCPVYDVSQEGESPYLTMGFIDGQPLSDSIANGPLAPRQAAELVRKLALALAEAHAKGVIHRDLKPANVMMTGRGEPVVVDFGLARRIDSNDSRLTQEGVAVGSPAYMAPEQVPGDLPQTPACDIYSLGVVLYELITGRLPFDGSVAQVMADILTKAPAAPSSHRAELDPALDRICQRAMAKKPRDRYASMEEFAQALSGYLAGSEGPIKPATGRGLWYLGGGMAAVLALGAIILKFNDGSQVRIDTPSNGKIEVNGKAVANIEKTDDVKIDLSGGAEKSEHTPTVANENPKEAAGTVADAHGKPVTSVAFSEDGKQAISIGEDRTLRTWTTETSKAAVKATEDGYSLGNIADDPTVSPDGRWWAYVEIMNVHVGNVETKTPLKELRVSTHTGPVAFARNAKRLVIASMATGGEVSAVVWDLDSDETYRFEEQPELEELKQVALSNDGKRGASVAKDGVRVWEVESGKLLRHFKKPVATYLAFTPDGKSLLMGESLGGISEWNIATGELAGRFEGHRALVTSLAYSADGKLLVSGSEDKTTRVWNVAGRTERMKISVHGSPLTCVGFSADGKRVVSGDRAGQVRVVPVE